MSKMLIVMPNATSPYLSDKYAWTCSSVRMSSYALCASCSSVARSTSSKVRTRNLYTHVFRVDRNSSGMEFQSCTRGLSPFLGGLASTHKHRTEANNNFLCPLYLSNGSSAVCTWKIRKSLPEAGMS
jgi:hypothetical protein